MFKDRGTKRAYKHNLRLATMLSFVAGIVNISGLLSFNVLTTNVTGHFAFFSEAFIAHNYTVALNAVLFILCFLAGSFFSSLMIEVVVKLRPGLAYVLPIITEAAIIAYVGVFINPQHTGNTVYIAMVLLFAMGLQNSLVTRVSRSVVRTTHLTGLFTDLGIELSQLFFYREKQELYLLTKSIYLKLFIIAFFFFGGIMGGVLYGQVGLKVLLFASFILILALLYDSLLLRYYVLRHKITHKP